MMSVLLITLALSTTPAADTTQTVSGSAERPFHEISKELQESLKREALASTQSERSASIHRLAELYLELKRDPRLDESPTLQRYKAKLWSRLTKVKKDLQAQLAREQAITVRRRTSVEIEAEQDAHQHVQQTSEILTAQLALVSYSLGGPAKVFADLGSEALGGGATGDDGAALVALITHVIEPDFWDVNGGPGTIFYYAPLHALVVRATDEVHRKIGGTIRGLRAAGP